MRWLFFSKKISVVYLLLGGRIISFLSSLYYLNDPSLAITLTDFVFSLLLGLFITCIIVVFETWWHRRKKAREYRPSKMPIITITIIILMKIILQEPIIVFGVIVFLATFGIMTGLILFMKKRQTVGIYPGISYMEIK